MSPLDGEYGLSDVIDDAFAILMPERKDVTKEKAEEYFQCKDEAEFRSKIYNILIGSRELALNSLRKGITLEGKQFVQRWVRCDTAYFHAF